MNGIRLQAFQQQNFCETIKLDVSIFTSTGTITRTIPETSHHKYLPVIKKHFEKTTTTKHQQKTIDEQSPMFVQTDVKTIFDKWQWKSLFLLFGRLCFGFKNRNETHVNMSLVSSEFSNFVTLEFFQHFQAWIFIFDQKKWKVYLTTLGDSLFLLSVSSFTFQVQLSINLHGY